MTTGSFLPLIIVAAVIVFIGLVIYLASKSMQNNNNDDNKTNSTGFFKGLLDEINSEFGQKQSAQQSVRYNEKPVSKTVKKEAQRIAAQTQPVQTVKPIAIAPALEVETGEDNNGLLDEIIEDEDIMTKLVLGEMIMTPRARRKNIRRLF